MTKHLFTRSILHLGMLLAAGFAAHSSAYANTSYALTLTPTTGTISGTGILTLATAIPLTGPFSATEGGAINANSTNLVSLSFTMSNGTTFSTAHEDGQASAFFFNDGLLNLSFNRNSVNPSLGIGGTHFDFSTNGNFSGPAYSGGTVTFNPVAIVASPEPTSMLFIGTGLVAIASLRRRKASNS